jgi:hypothetical protein
LGAWLNADEVHVQILPSQARPAREMILDSLTDYDLVIAEEPLMHSLKDQVHFARVRRWLLQSGKTTLFARKFCWPLTSLVCLLLGHPTDLENVRWVSRLVRSSDCSVEVLVPVPQVPLMYADLREMRITLDTILAGNSLPGRWLRQSLNYLSNWDIHANIRLLHGYSRLQIRAELISNLPDLLIMSGGTEVSRTGAWIEPLVADMGHSVLVVHSHSSDG